jgi:PHP family Zn ribbon phosphoesterase
VGKKHNRITKQWRTMDIHIHTPASSDYQQPEVTFLDILQRAEARGLDIIAFTDHNTISGYRKMKEEIQQLELLSTLGRLLPEEKNRLDEYHRLCEKILILPGIEFTATFGFHILAIFPPDKSIREIEHLLLTLNIPPNQLDDGSATVGATTDVLTAYRILNQGGGLVIAAHANSSNGVAMRGFNFGGQTKIAYTQDPNLHALEVTDLEQKGGRTTAAFFNGAKPEYPRRMHCIQGSDAHRLVTDPQRKKNPGIGDRSTDVLIPELSFSALMELFTSNDFACTRPHRHKEEPAYDFIHAAREEGPNIIQDFHDSLTIRGGKLYNIIADICAFANTNGGTLYIGLGSEPKIPPLGISDPEAAINLLEKEIDNRINPPIQPALNIHDYQNKKIIRVLIPRGVDPPYAVDENKIYIRDEAETGLAVRDEIVNLVLRGQKEKLNQQTSSPLFDVSEAQEAERALDSKSPEEDVSPRTGVEVISLEEREGAKYFAMRDLRNGNVVKNVSLSSARRLWHYAIKKYLEIDNISNPKGVEWQGDYGIIRRYKQGKTHNYDLVLRTPFGNRYFFGVTEDGIRGEWKVVAGIDDV